MSQQEEKEQLESRSTESEENPGQIPGSDEKTQQTKEAKLKAREAAKEAKQKEQEDKLREKQLAEEAKLKARQIAEEAKQREQEVKLREKQLAEEAKLKARQAAKEAKQKEQEDKHREKHLAEEAKLKAKETNKTDVTPDKAASLENIISRDNNEMMSGSVTLEFDPGIHHSKVSQVTNSLSKNSNVQVVSVGGYAGKGSWVRLIVNNATPIYQVLYSTSIVQQVSRRGNNIHVIFHVSE
jgi:hypothetical protein